MSESSLATAVMRVWMRRSGLPCLLWPLSLVFALLSWLRLCAYRHGLLAQHKLSVPVIVVGNILVGGTGKTPFTIWLCGQLQQAGYRPGVISRGYGGEREDVRHVSANSKASEVGDEPLLIAQRTSCPVVVSRSRVQAGRALLTQNPEVDIIISDDGLQHMALHRDVEIMMFDGRAIGNGWLLPAGPLREPVTRHRDLTVANLNSTETIAAVLPADTVRMRLVAERAEQLAGIEASRPLHGFGAGFKVVAAAGIGNPERFFGMLGQHQIQFKRLPLPDHFDFSSNPFEGLDADLILITEKDAVKCRQTTDIAHDQRVWSVPVKAELDDNTMSRILACIKR